MKKIFLLLSLLLTTLVSCQRKVGANSSEDAVVFDSIAIDTLVRLNPHFEQPFAQLSLHLVYAKPNGSNKKANKAAQKLNDCLLTSGLLMSDFTESLTLTSQHDKTQARRMKAAIILIADNFVKRYFDDYQQLYKDDSENATGYNRSYTINTKMERCCDSIVNYVANTYNYDGGAHGQQATWARNFNTHSGALVKLADVLRSGYERKLTNLIVDNLASQFRVNGLEQLQDEMSVFAGMEPYIPENYIIRAKGITFIYGQDEIAAHAIGEIRATISYKQLDGLVRKP